MKLPDPKGSSGSNGWMDRIGHDPNDEPPPVLRTWPRVYRVVLAYLVLLIAALYLFMKVFSPSF